MISQDQFSAYLQNLDAGLFDYVPSQTGGGDRKSLLTIQNIVRNVIPHYVYFEIGSHLGGTLVPHLMDPLCRHVISVDKRPPTQMDERGVMFDYNQNSTKKMLATLESQVPAATLLKLATFDLDSSELNGSQIPVKVDYAFIDGEHTNVAVFRDFLSTMRFLSESSIVGFHDAHLLCDGLQNIECLLRDRGIVFNSYFLHDNLYLIVTGEFANIACQALERMSRDRDKFIQDSRIALWRIIAGNVALIDGNAIGHLPA